MQVWWENVYLHASTSLRIAQQELFMSFGRVRIRVSCSPESHRDGTCTSVCHITREVWKSYTQSLRINIKLCPLRCRCFCLVLLYNVANNRVIRLLQLSTARALFIEILHNIDRYKVGFEACEMLV